MTEEVSAYIEPLGFTKCCERYNIKPEEITTQGLQNLFESTINTLNNTMYSFLVISTTENRDKERFKLWENFKIIADKSMNPDTKRLYEEVRLMLKELLILRGYMQQITDIAGLTIHYNTNLEKKIEELRLNMVIKDFSKEVDRKFLEAALKPKKEEIKEEREQEEKQEEEPDIIEKEVNELFEDEEEKKTEPKKKTVKKETEEVDQKEKMLSLIEEAMPTGLSFFDLCKKLGSHKVGSHAEEIKRIKDELTKEGKIEKNGTQFQIKRG